jgi:hypothetical protein
MPKVYQQFVATDSIKASKTTARLLEKEISGIKALVINSETSGNLIEKEFVQNPDAIVAPGLYDVIICSPTMATGVSIETQGIITKVYGIFTGGSSTDADIAQSLVRVREPVERIIWCAKRGNNFCKASRSTNSLEVKTHLQQRSNATVSLIRSNLRPDIVEEISSYDWQSNPHVNLYAQISAKQNFSMLNLRSALLVRLKHEGHQITIDDRESSRAVKLLLGQIREEIKRADAEAIVAADDLTYAEVFYLESQESVSPEDRLAIKKFYLKEFYCLDTLTVDDVLRDSDGMPRAQLLNLEAQVYPDIAADITAKALEKQANWNKGICPWDISGTELRRWMREVIRLNDFLDPNKEWTKFDIRPYADRARQYATNIKHHLNFTIHDKVSDVQIVHQLLAQLGIKISFRWSRSVPGFEGQKIMVYRLDADRWQAMTQVLERRLSRRQRLQQQGNNSGSPLPVIDKKQTGDPELESLLPESEPLQNSVGMWVAPDAQSGLEDFEGRSP